jgi:hypothetical protein
MKHLKLKLAIFALSTFLFSCSNDLETTNTTANTKTYNGILVLNEGGFTNSNSSISFLSKDFSELIPNIFSTVNPNIVMGDVAQSMLVSGDKIYVVVNNSNKLLVLNRYTLQQIGNISTGLVNPRFMAIKNNILYLSCWGIASVSTDDYIAVINTNDLSTLPKILVAEGPEKMTLNNNELFVAHKGGFSNGKTISVINISNNTITNTINTGDIPENLAIYNNQLFVFCSGKIVYDTNWNIINQTGGKIINYNLSNYSEIFSINFNNTEHPRKFCINQDKIYYSLNNQIYKKDFLTTTLPPASFFNPQVTTLYGLNVTNNNIFVCDAKAFNSAGSLKIFNETGTLITEKATGIAPNGVYFN